MARFGKLWICAIVQVYDSLVKSEEMSESDLAHFNVKEGANLLYELRFVPQTARAASALYMKEKDMNAHVSFFEPSLSQL